nr:peroxide stress protein YaaA [Micromonospora sp. DSM 115978]
MRIFLPPSEAKTAGGVGPSLRIAGFGGSALAEPREQVLRAVAAFCQEDPAAAAAALKLPASRAEADLAANIGVLEAPTTSALDRFTGVIYAALDVATLPAPARAVADRSVLIVSGAFGLLAAHEPVPEHRVPMSASVPGLGVLATWWRRHVDPVATSLISQTAGTAAADHAAADQAATDDAATDDPAGFTAGITADD